jgi:heat shock protein HslJ
MTDETEQILRKGITELLLDKPDLGPIDLDQVRAASRLRSPSRRPVTRWLAVAAAVVVLVGLGAGLWFGLLRPAPSVTHAEPAKPAASLAGTTWLATQIKGRPAVFDAQGRVPYLRFGDQSVDADDTCNRIAGSYRLDGEQLTLDGLRVTTAYCSDRLEVLEQRRDYLHALEKATRLELGGSTLTLSNAKGTPVLTFHAADPSPTPVTDVQVRIRNDSGVDLEHIRVNFAGRTVDYGTVRAGQSSDYRHAGKAYRYAPMRATADGEQLEYAIFDYMGETLLPPGRYTYVLAPTGRSLSLRLEVDQ